MDTPNTPPPTIPTPSATPVTPSGPLAELTAPPGTALQIAQMLAAGSIDTTQAGKLAKAGNISTMHVAQALNALRGAAEPHEPDLRSPEVKQLDAHFPAAKPEEYLIRYDEPGQDLPMTPGIKQFDTTARTWMSGAGLPREVGNSLVTQISRVAQQTQRMSPDELITYGENEYVKLQQAHGATLEEKLQSAAEMIHALDLKQPGLKNLLRSNGIGDNALVASMLIGHAAIYHARKGH